jgi:hypothetical protein
MLNLRKSFHALIPQPQQLMDFPLYLTLGQTLTDAELEKARKDLVDFEPQFQFPGESFDLLREEPDGSWETVGTFHFRG